MSRSIGTHAGGEPVPISQLNGAVDLVDQIKQRANVTGPLGRTITAPNTGATQTTCRCVESLHIVSHRGASIGAVSGEISFGVGKEAEASEDPNVRTPVGTGPWTVPVTFISPAMRPRPRSKTVLEYTIKELAMNLSSIMCFRSCSIEVYGCAFAGGDSGRKSMQEMASNTLCHVYGTTALNVIGPGGWALAQAGQIVEMDPWGRERSVAGHVGKENAKKYRMMNLMPM
jgi:hypothetical protein